MAIVEETTTTNDNLTPDELGELKARLEAEQQAKAAFEAMLAEKDSQISQLSAEVDRLTADVEALKGESDKAAQTVTQLQGELAQATVKYRDLIAATNPAIPADLITGSTIEEIDASVVKAKALVEKVKAGIEAEAKAAEVPAGAPARTTVIPEGLSTREKLRYGLSQARK